MHQPAPNKGHREPVITAKGQQLVTVDKFTYLGSTVCSVVHSDDEIDAKIAKSSAAFDILRSIVWRRRGIKLPTKLKVYKAVVMPTLEYDCETRTPYKKHTKKLNRFHITCLRWLLNIRWRDKNWHRSAISRHLSLHSNLAVKDQIKWWWCKHARWEVSEATPIQWAV